MNYLRSIFVSLVISISLTSCSIFSGEKTGFKYELSQQAYQAELETSLQMQTDGNKVNFSIIFSGGGGSYDKARLEQSNNILRIILFDVDGKLQNMWVTYKLSGAISGLATGNYKLQIEDSDSNIISNGAFEIQ